MDSIEAFIRSFPPALTGPVLFTSWLVALWLAKVVLFRRLKAWASRTKAQWDDAFIEQLTSSMSLPADLLIVCSGLVLLAGTMHLPERYVSLSKALFQGCVILTIVMLADRLLRLAVSRYARGGALGQMSQGVVQGLLRGFVIGLGVLIFLDQLGISITPVLASLGIGSLAVALALQDTLSNFFSGLYISVDRPVEIGHFVKLESGDEGYVTDIGWRNTRVRTLSNNTVIIPNTKLIGSVITNYYIPDTKVAVLVEMGVHYDSDLSKVESVVAEVGRDVMKTVEGGVPGFEPFIRYHTLGEYSVKFTVILQAREFTDNYLLKHEFIKRIVPRLKKEDIEIPYPIRTTVQLAN